MVTVCGGGELLGPCRGGTGDPPRVGTVGATLGGGIGGYTGLHELILDTLQSALSPAPIRLRQVALLKCRSLLVWLQLRCRRRGRLQRVRSYLTQDYERRLCSSSEPERSSHPLLEIP